MMINGKEYNIRPKADLCNADLRSAELRSANLHGSNLSATNLRGADLRGANLQGADLRHANLCDATLQDADMRHADLRRATLRDAFLYRANLSGANLRGADLSDANLQGAENIPALAAAQTLIVPAGQLIVYKKLADGTICELEIPVKAKRCNATGRKCRAEFAVVLKGNGFSNHDPSFEYKEGEIVRPTEPFDEDRWNECGSGIHFFLTREEAEAH